MKSDYTYTLHKELGDKFGVKVDLLNIGAEKQIELLNKMYDDTLEFAVTNTSSSFYDDSIEYGIIVKNIKRNIMKIVLPETKALYMRDLFFLSDLIHMDVASVEIPKCISSIKLNDISWINGINRLFVHDTTEIDFNNFSKRIGSKLQMVIVTSDSGKSKIYRF